MKAANIADRYSIYSQKFSLIQTHAASHAAVMPCVIAVHAHVIHVTNGSIAHHMKSIADVIAALIVSRFVTTIYASHAIAATTNHIGEIRKARTVPTVVIPATIAGIANPSVPTTATNQAIDPAINMILPNNSGFSVAQVVNAMITGCTVDSNCWKAGANAPPTASCRSPNDSANIADCPATVFQNSFA